jgi:hypothetical protein
MKRPTVRVLSGPEAEQGFELTPEERAFLLESIAQADRGEVVDGWQLLDEIQD